MTLGLSLMGFSENTLSCTDAIEDNPFVCSFVSVNLDQFFISLHKLDGHHFDVDQSNAFSYARSWSFTKS